MTRVSTTAEALLTDAAIYGDSAQHSWTRQLSPGELFGLVSCERGHIILIRGCY